MISSTEPQISISDGTKNVDMNWTLTGRPFKRNKSRYTSEEVADLEKTFGPWEENEYVLGFQESDVQGWIDNENLVLEIGPGEGNAFKELLERGVDLYAIEPSLLSETLKDLKDPILQSARKLFLGKKARGRVAATKAVDSQYAFPGKQFDVAFAIGPNFQNYSRSAPELLSQLAGIMSTLKPDQNSSFTFQIGKNGKCILDMMNRGKNGTHHFNMLQFLKVNEIQLTASPTFEDHTPVLAIRIHRLNENGDDASIRLSNALKHDLSPFLS